MAQSLDEFQRKLDALVQQSNQRVDEQVAAYLGLLEEHLREHNREVNERMRETIRQSIAREVERTNALIATIPRNDEFPEIQIRTIGACRAILKRFILDQEALLAKYVR